MMFCNQHLQGPSVAQLFSLSVAVNSIFECEKGDLALAFAHRVFLSLTFGQT
jgi:hypothetical protein